MFQQMTCAWTHSASSIEHAGSALRTTNNHIHWVHARTLVQWRSIGFNWSPTLSKILILRSKTAKGRHMSDLMCINSQDICIKNIIGPFSAPIPPHLYIFDRLSTIWFDNVLFFSSNEGKVTCVSHFKSDLWHSKAFLCILRKDCVIIIPGCVKTDLKGQIHV